MLFFSIFLFFEEQNITKHSTRNFIFLSHICGEFNLKLSSIVLSKFEALSNVVKMTNQKSRSPKLLAMLYVKVVCQEKALLVK